MRHPSSSRTVRMFATFGVALSAIALACPGCDKDSSSLALSQFDTNTKDLARMLPGWDPTGLGAGDGVDPGPPVDDEMTFDVVWWLP